MNSTALNPNSASPFKCSVPLGSTLARPLLAERDGLAQELDHLRKTEANLRAYETRLRVWQDRLDRGDKSEPATQPCFPASGSRAPMVNDPELQAAWTKLYRAHELLQAEQAYLRDERIAISARESELKRREGKVTMRESYIARREGQAAAERVAASVPMPPKKAPSMLTRLTRSPFFGVRAVADSAK